MVESFIRQGIVTNFILTKVPLHHHWAGLTTSSSWPFDFLVTGRTLLCPFCTSFLIGGGGSLSLVCLKGDSAVEIVRDTVVSLHLVNLTMNK